METPESTPTALQCLRTDPDNTRARLEALVPEMVNISTVTDLSNRVLRRASHYKPHELAKWFNEKPLLVSVVDKD